MAKILAKKSHGAGINTWTHARTVHAYICIFLNSPSFETSAKSEIPDECVFYIYATISIVASLNSYSSSSLFQT